MAVRITRELVCDMCGSDSAVRRWRITRDDTKKVSPDLCGECSSFLDDVFAKLPSGKRGQSHTRPVLTEAQVRAQRRKKT